ncbi:MAG: hypothetical protein MPN21_19210 [Thermoanaerobaculia bacterium]|nr:hypothetical protein [Thermoanaerobaculia bacterium]
MRIRDVVGAEVSWDQRKGGFVTSPGFWPRRTPRRAPEDDLFGPEYSVVRLRASWTTLAYLCTLLCMSARYWMRWIPFEQGWRRPFVTVVVMVGLSVLGTFAAWTAIRQEASGINKIAMLCNLVAFVLSIFSVAIVFIIMP